MVNWLLGALALLMTLLWLHAVTRLRRERQAPARSSASSPPPATAPQDLTQLTELFRKVGARDPGGWAASQLNEGIPQLGRYLFLRAAWRNVVSEGDTRWMDAVMEHTRRDPTGVGAVPALERLLSHGIAREDLNAVVRTSQYELLFGLMYLLDDPGELEPEVQDTAWGLFLVDGDGRPTAHLGGLHESVLELDPTGGELPPRPATP